MRPATAVRYVVALGKRDITYLGRFTFDTLMDFEGLARVLTIIARGYLFHHRGGSLADNPRSRIEHTHRALCAWCSIPDTKTAAPIAEWQFQTPIFSPSTKRQWIIRFDDAVAGALELGPLRNDNIEIPQELETQLKAVVPKGIPFEVVRTLIAYYEANKPVDSDWVVLPVTNFDAYFGSTSFGRKYLKLIPEEILERADSGFGFCQYRVMEKYLT